MKKMSQIGIQLVSSLMGVIFISLLLMSCSSESDKTFINNVPLKTVSTNAEIFEHNVNCLDSIEMRGKGYWKTHSEYGPAPYDATWAMLSQGSDTPFFNSGMSYFELFWTSPIKGNAYITLAHQWMAAELNILNSTYVPDDVSQAIDDAKQWFEDATESDFKEKTNHSDSKILRALASILADYNDNLCSPTAPPRVLIVVSNPLKETGLIDTSLSTYQRDILAQGFPSEIITVNSDAADTTADHICPTEVELKNIILDYYDNGNGIEGLVFIGSHPEIPNVNYTFHRQHSETPSHWNPTDLYYTDMDEWIDIDGNGCYESYDSKEVYNPSQGKMVWTYDLTQPANPDNTPYTADLFFGRITAGPFAADITEEANMVAAYLDKAHDYRVNGSSLTEEQFKRTLVFQDDDWSYSKGIASQWRHMTPNIVGGYDRFITSGTYLGQEVQRGYRMIASSAHSGPAAYQSHDWLNGIKIYSGEYNLDFLDTVDVNVNYLHMNNCSANKFTVKNLGGHHLFKNQHPLNTTGSTGPWGFNPDNQFFYDLADGMPIGIALFDFMQRNTANNIIHGYLTGWAKGTLQGDPLITYPNDDSNMAPMINANTYQIEIQQDVPYTLDLVALDPEGDAVTVEITSGMPSLATFDGRYFNWTPTAADAGFQSAIIDVIAMDSNSNYYKETFTISVLPEDGVLLNGGFEMGTTTVNFWNVASWQPAVTTWEPVGTGRNGGRCVSIENTTGNDTRWFQIVTGLTEGNTYRLTAWVKGENISGNLGAHLTVDGSTNWNGLTGTFDWQQLTHDFTVSGDSATVELRMGYWGTNVTGKVWFDDVSLEQLN